MCTLITLRRPGHAWPLIVAANRDERLDRLWDPPSFWWPDRPGVYGGRDRSGGGTWMALGRSGVLAAVLNRPGSLGPAAGKRSRGELPLLAADSGLAAAGAAAIGALDAGLWRPFNMVVADARAGFFIRGLGEGRPQVTPLPEGIAMVTAHDPNDLGSPRTARHLPRFRQAAPPDPDANDWAAWQALLADSDFDPAIGPAETLNVPPTDGFGTVSSSLLAFAEDGRCLWRFAPGRPGSQPFRPIPLPFPAPEAAPAAGWLQPRHAPAGQ